MKRTVCDERKCTGCKACVDKCPKSCIVIKDELSYLNAVIDQEKCIGCDLCQTVCPVKHLDGLRKPIEWKQGWSLDEIMRGNASSGGVASAIVASFLNKGGVVYACLFKKGEFGFERIESENDIKQMRGSKYVKSNPEGVYCRIIRDLKNESKVLFIGLPCQIKAARNFVGQKLDENFFTVDLICHGSPSSQILADYLNEKKININTIESIRFRKKTRFGLSTSYHDLSPAGGMDAYLMAFLSGLSYTENCFNCQFAQLDRAGDITIGDSWGSTLSADEQEKGISLILCQTLKGQTLIHDSQIHLESVDLERAVAMNHQLMYPTKKPKRYDTFWKGIKNGRSLRFMILRCYPKATINSMVKSIRTKLGGGGTT